MDIHFRSPQGDKNKFVCVCVWTEPLCVCLECYSVLLKCVPIFSNAFPLSVFLNHVVANTPPAASHHLISVHLKIDISWHYHWMLAQPHSCPQDILLIFWSSITVRAGRLYCILFTFGLIRNAMQYNWIPASTSNYTDTYKPARLWTTHTVWHIPRAHIHNTIVHKYPWNEDANSIRTL